ncbi:cytochrome P450 [Peniophora sp. CONT]|nr:cytochrome P450 [Peniophora sp. CONT]
MAIFDSPSTLLLMAIGLLSLDALLVLSVLVLASAWQRLKAAKARESVPLPPGPPGLPIFDNLLDIPKANEWITYRDWSIKYGCDLIHFSSFGVHTIVVNSTRAASELFEKRSAMYSDRPVVTAVKYIGMDWLLGLTRYGATWRLRRKSFHDQFRPEILAKYEALEVDAVHAFLRTLVSNSGEFKAGIRHMTAKIIMRIAFGIDVQGVDDPYVQLAEDTLHAINVATSFEGLIFDFFPFLQHMPAWFPGAGFKRFAEHVRQTNLNRAAVDGPWEAMLKDKLTESEDNKHFSAAGNIFDKHQDDPALQEVLKSVPSTMYLGGADTTVSSLLSFFMAMALYPGVQKKAQKELDDVLGGTLPTLADRERLPYLDALVKEVFRWHPVTALALPHAATTDDVYEGMFIPAGCIVIGNVWAILHNPALFPDPESFNPAHFISAETGGTYPKDACKNGVPPFPEAAFGFGRRLCPGRALAKVTVWMTVASVLSAFDISLAKDENGRDIPITDTWSSGMVGFPGPYGCEIKTRGKEAETMVMATAVD